MSLFQAFVLGLVQGLTEFIPISSSGHLVLVPWVLRWPQPGLAFDTMAHWGTLTAVLVYFWRDWMDIARGFFNSLRTPGPWTRAGGGRLADPNSRLAWWIILGTIPAVILGLAFQDFLESLFATPAAVGVLLLCTALILVLGERFARTRRDLATLGWVDVLLIGLAQAAALAPGISRSGATITAGMLRGLSRDTAARFSFLLGTPAVLGAGLLQLLALAQVDGLTVQLPVLMVGFLVAAVSGYLCIRFLLAYLRSGKLYVFAGYCAAIGLAALLAAALI